MKVFNKDKELRKLKFKQNKNNYIKRVSIVLSCVILVVAIMMFSFAYYNSNAEWTLIKGKVSEPAKDANIIAIYQDDTKIDSIPAKNSGWYFDRAECTNGATASWDDNEWLLKLNLTTKTKCTLYFVSTLKAVAYLKLLDKNANSLVEDGTSDNNLRYIGANPNNYVQFNNELWRIIGVMNNIQTGNGQTQSLLKIIRSDSLGQYSWDTTPLDETTYEINYGQGINQWGASGTYEGADLMRELNTDYLGNITVGTDEKWFNGPNNTKSANMPTTTLSSDAQSTIESVVWNLGSPLNDNGSYDSAFYEILTSTSYTRERASTNGKVCTSGDYCNDSVTRTSTWTGKVGLIYPSDYAYATSGGSTNDRQSCLNKPMTKWFNASDCYSNDWLYDSNYYQWTLSPYANTSRATSVFYVRTDSLVSGVTAHADYSVRPVVYLKSSTAITGGDGSSSNPYTLG